MSIQWSSPSTSGCARAYPPYNTGMAERQSTFRRMKGVMGQFEKAGPTGAPENNFRKMRIQFFFSE
jgi:hypothetical protein